TAVSVGAGGIGGASAARTVAAVNPNQTRMAINIRREPRRRGPPAMSSTRSRINRPPCRNACSLGRLAVPGAVFLPAGRPGSVVHRRVKLSADRSACLYSAAAWQCAPGRDGAVVLLARDAVLRGKPAAVPGLGL